MPIETFKPECQVTVYTRDDRRADINPRIPSTSQIDLTQWLGEGSQVWVRKSVREPAGKFSITVPDQPAVAALNGTGIDSLYGLLQPMDYVEIRMARSPNEYVTPQADGNTLPVKMRGFVSSVRRTEVIVDNQPRRATVISGFDFGMAAQRYTVAPRTGYPLTTDYLTAFPLTSLGIGNTFMAAWQWIEILVGLQNSWLQKLTGIAGFATGLLPLMQVDVNVKAAIWPYNPQQSSASILSMLEAAGDFAWNELFVEDRAAAPTVVYRPIPYTDMNRQPIQGGTVPRMKNAAGGSLTLMDDAIVSLDCERSDSDVANYFLVQSQMALSDPTFLTAAAIDGRGAYAPFQSGHPANSPGLYSVRAMETVTTQLGPQAAGSPHPSESTSTAAALQQDLQGWLSTRHQALMAMNQDNALYESGTIVARGSERFTPGNYLDLKRGKLSWEVYVHCVEHDYRPYNRYISNLYYDRGTNYIVRTGESQSPVLIEGARGVYAGA